MSNIQIHKSNIPSNVEDIHKFILVGREVLKAHKAKIRAIDKVNAAYAAKEAALSDTQDIAEALIEAEARLGDMLEKIDKREARRSSRSGTSSPVMPEIFRTPEGRKMSSFAQTIAKNKDVARQVVAEAKANKSIATPHDVYAEIKRREKEEKFERAKRDASNQVSKNPNPPKIFKLDAESFLETCEAYDLLLTDPPYMTDVDNIETFAKWLPRALKRMRPTGRAYVFVGAYPDELRAYLSVSKPEQMLVWTYRNTLGPSPSHNYKLNWQAILYFKGKDAPPLNCPIMLEQFSVHDINAPDGRLGNRYYQWQKPDEIADRFIRHSTSPGDLIVDPFAGSGSFLLSASRLGRRSIGAEIDASVIKIAKERGCV